MYGRNFIEQHSETVSLWLEISKMPIAVWEKKIIVIYYNFPHTFVADMRSE